jgi:3D (Asp-Asp-Asp) domain-containing protein
MSGLQPGKRRFQMRNCSQKVSMFLTLAVLTTMGSTAWARKEDPQVEIKKIPLPVEVRYEFSRSVRPGSMVKAQVGQPGVLEQSWSVTYQDGKPVKRELVEEQRTGGKPTLFLISRAGFTTSRGEYTRGKVLDMKASAYDASPRTIGPKAAGRTKLGYRATYGHVAVDPRVIPLGSLVYVEGYGMALASDIGGAIRGKRIDLCYASRSQAVRFGRRQVKVHILRAGH